jgi:cytochrome P450
VRSLRPEVEAIAKDFITKISAHGNEPFDLITEFALPLPVRVIARLLGIPSEGDELIQTWSEALLKADLENPEQTYVIADEISAFLHELVQAKRQSPDNSLISALVQTKRQASLSDEEITTMGFLLLTAGHETTVI